MSRPTVVLTQCSDYSRQRLRQAIARQFELLDALEQFAKPGDSVLIKPNLIAPRPRSCATQTDPAVIVETARLLKDFGARPFVADSPAWSNAFACVKALEIDDELKKLSVPVRQLNKPRQCRIGTAGTKVGISSVALDADVIINLPKFKTHQQLVATFALKNMFGCVSGKKKALWHFAKGKKERRFCSFLIDIYRYLKPAVTIIDAVAVMDGPGPIKGRARPLGYLIGGAEPIACEFICCKLVNIAPEQIPIIRTARQIGFGTSDSEEIDVVGDELAAPACADFELPQLIPIRFSLLHVCKSACKQIFLLGKAAAKKLRS
ncbi:MAG: DUF362 domain-containing protein [Planctomycetota bacterium]